MTITPIPFFPYPLLLQYDPHSYPSTWHTADSAGG